MEPLRQNGPSIKFPIRMSRVVAVVFIVLATACSSDGSESTAPATVPPAAPTSSAQIEEVEAPSQTVVVVDAEPIDLEAFGTRIHIGDVSATWLNENLVVLNATGEIENIDLAGSLDGGLAWGWQCDGQEPSRDSVYGGSLGTINGSVMQIVSKPKPGFSPEFWYAENIESLTSRTFELPTILFPLAAARSGDLACVEFEVFLVFEEWGLVNERIVDERAGANGVVLRDSDSDRVTGWIDSAIDLDALLRELPPPPADSLQLDTLCAALAQQDLEPLLRKTVSGWVSGGDDLLNFSLNRAAACVVGGIGVMVSNAGWVNAEIREWWLPNLSRADSSSAVWTRDGFGVVDLGGAVVYFDEDQPNNLDEESTRTFGRLIERLAAQS